MMKRLIRFSQNFLYNPTLIQSLLTKTDITPNDTVYDVGAGKGIISTALAPRCRTVIAIEADHKLVSVLRGNLKRYANVLVYEGDFLRQPLPETPYKVFANIPFNMSADIVHKLLDGKNPPVSCYLIVQKEFAQKLVTGSQNYNSQLAILLGVQYKVRIIEEISPNNFRPMPRVTSVLLEILRRPSAPIPAQDLQTFRNFVIYAYNAFKPTVADSLSQILTKQEFTQAAKRLGFSTGATPTQLTLENWLGLFDIAMQKPHRLELLVNDYEQRFASKHASRTKLHRTRQPGSTAS